MGYSNSVKKVFARASHRMKTMKTYSMELEQTRVVLETLTFWKTNSYFLNKYNHTMNI